MNKDEVYSPDGALAGQIIRGPAVVTETVTTHSGRETAYHLVVGGEREAEQLRAIVARCQSLAAWLTRHSNLGFDVEADGIRRATGDRLYAALGVPSPPAEWERHGFPSVQGRCPACGGSLFLGSGGYVTCRRLSCSEPDAASTLLGKHRQAEAAIERVRAECEAIGTPHICNAVDRILAALDEPQERP